MFAIFITLGMSGLYVNIYNSICNLLGFELKEEIVIVQNVSAYSSETLQMAIENVESVNIMDLTICNDISYSGDVLESKDMSCKGSNVLYLDLNEHNLTVDTPHSKGIYLEKSTFYSVDNVGGGRMDVEANGTGLTCKNLVIESGKVTSKVVQNPNFDGSEILYGPEIPDEFETPVYTDEQIKDIIEDSDYFKYVDNPLSADDVYEDLVGESYSGEKFREGYGDGVRCLDNATVGTQYSRAFLDCRGSASSEGGVSLTMFRMQKYYSGIRVGSEGDLNDGTLTVWHKDTEFRALGGMGLFANSVYFYGGKCYAFGGCGYYNKEKDPKGDQVGLYFSDPFGMDGKLIIGADAEVHVATPNDTCGIFTYCCDEVSIAGKLYSGCNEPGYYTNNGNIVFSQETNYFSSEYAEDKYFLQDKGLAVDIGKIRMSGNNAEVFILARGRALMAGQEVSGWNSEETSVWEGGNGCIDGRYGSTTGWISKTVADQIRARTPDKDLKEQLSHAGTIEIDDGAFVMIQSYGGSNDCNDSIAVYLAGDLFVIGGTADKLTKVYLLGDTRSMKLLHAKLYVKEGAFVSADVTDKCAVDGTYLKSISCSIDLVAHSAKLSGARGGGLRVEGGGILEVEHWGWNKGNIYGIYAEGDVKVRTGGTLRVYCKDKNNNEDYGSVAVLTKESSFIESDATVQLWSTGPALRVIHDDYNLDIKRDLTITGENTYCSFVSGKKRQYNYCAPLSVNGSLTIVDAEVYAALEEDSHRDNEAAFSAKDTSISGNAKVTFNNAGKGITAYGNISISGNASYASRGVKYGINSPNGGSVNIGGNATINIQSDFDGINCASSVSISGTPKVSVSSSSSGGGTGIWAKQSVTVNMSNGGYLGISAVGADYGIYTEIGDTTIKGSGTVTVEAKSAGIHTPKNVKITANEGADFSFFGSSEDGIRADGKIEIDGTEGKVNCYGYRYGIYSCGTSGNNVEITGSVNLVADGTYGGTNSVLSGASYVSGYKKGDGTSGLTVSNNKSYNTLAEYAIDNGGGFYSVIGKEGTNHLMAAIGEEYVSDKDNIIRRADIVSRVNPTGGPEEIWYFEYFPDGDSNGNYKGSFKIQNYLTKEYISVHGSKPSVGGRIVTKANPSSKQSHFYILHASTMQVVENGVTKTIARGPEYNGYVIVSVLNDKDLPVSGGEYGVDFGKYCLDSNGTIGDKVSGCYGTQQNDKIKIHLWPNDDVSKKYNGSQIFNICPIVDFGTVFTARIKSVYKNKYLNFNEGKSSFFFSDKEKDLFTLTKDATELYPMAYEIKNSSCLDVSGGVFANGTAVSAYKEDNDSASQRFRIVYSLYNGNYSLQIVKGTLIVYVSSSEAAMRLVDPHYEDIKNDKFESRRKFCFELDSPYTFLMDGKSNNAKTYYDAMFPTDILHTKTTINGETSKVVTLKLTLTTGDVNRFVLTTALNNAENVNPMKWELFESESSKIGKSIKSSENTGYNPMYAGDKIVVDFTPSNKSNNVYYLVLYSQPNAPFIGIQEVSFYQRNVAHDNSAGIRCTNQNSNDKLNCIDIQTSGGTVYVKGLKYGIRAYTEVFIKGTGSTFATLSNVKVYGVGSTGIAVVGPTGVTTENCTLIAEGEQQGITSNGYITINANSTIDAISKNPANYGITTSVTTKGVKISPSASVRTVGKKYTQDAQPTESIGSISPAPVNLSGDAIYEVQFHYATVEKRTMSSRKYEQDYFTAMLYKKTASTPQYSTLAKNYQQFATYYGLGHNDSVSHYSLYFFLPAYGSESEGYINIVEGKDGKTGATPFYVDYGVSGYNKVDEKTGELMFTAKYDMPGYNQISDSYITSAIVVGGSARVDVYPLEAFYLETFQMSANGTSLTTEDKNKLATALSWSDNDDYYTWSEVKYFIENIIPSGQTVSVKVLKNSLAFSTITVPTGVTVNLTADSTVNVARAAVDRNIEISDGVSWYDIQLGYIKNPQGGYYPLEGESGDKMLPGYDKIKHFYAPSELPYINPDGGSVNPDGNNDNDNGLKLPLFHLERDADIIINDKVNFDAVGVGAW